MDIIRLPDGVIAPPEADCIRLLQRDDGRYEMTGTALLACGDGEDEQSVTVTGSEPYATFEEAEAAGLAWANEHCVQQLFVTKLSGDD